MKQLINKFFDRITPKLPQYCAIEPVREPNTPIVEEKTPTPMTEKEKLVIDKLNSLLERENIKIEKHKLGCSQHYKIIVIEECIKIYACQVFINDTSILHNPSDEAREELKNIIQKIVIKNNQEKLDNFLKL